MNLIAANFGAYAEVRELRYKFHMFLTSRYDTYWYQHHTLLHDNTMPRGSKFGSKNWDQRQRDTDLYCKARALHIQGQTKHAFQIIKKISSKTGSENAKILLNHEPIAKALDPLLALDGLREGFWLKMMHRVLYSGCDEVFLG